MFEGRCYGAMSAFSQAKATSDKQNQHGNPPNNRSVEDKDDDDGDSHYPHSVNLLLDNDDDDNDTTKSQDSEETELPSHNLQFGSVELTKDQEQQRQQQQEQRQCFDVQTSSKSGSLPDPSHALPNHDVSPKVLLRSPAASQDSSSSPSSTTGLHGTPPPIDAIASTTKDPSCSKNNSTKNSEQQQSAHPSPRGEQTNDHYNTNASPRVLPFQSPTTHTLKALSQDMNVLQYPDNASEEEQKEITPISNKTNMKVASSRTLSKQTTRSMTGSKHKQASGRMFPPLPQRQVTNPIKPTTDSNNKQDKPQKNKGDQTIGDDRDIDSVQYELPPNFSHEWKIVSIKFPTTERASLGIAIVRKTFPELEPQPIKKHCMISRIMVREQKSDHGTSSSAKIKPYCGSQYGLREGDWFLTPGKEYTTRRLVTPTLASFDEIAAWSKKRPYRSVCVLRRRTRDDHKNGDDSTRTRATAATSKQSASNVTASNTGPKKRTAPPTATAASKLLQPPSKKTKRSTSTSTSTFPRGRPPNIKRLMVPFCNRCNAERNNKKRIPNLHHAWCPQNHYFDNSGAYDVVRRIVHGRNLGCPACEKEFETGKPISKHTTTGGGSGALHHNRACLQNQRRFDQERNERDDQKGSKEKKQQQQQRQTTQKKTTKSAAMTSQSRSKQQSPTKKTKIQRRNVAKGSDPKNVQPNRRWTAVNRASSSSSEEEKSDDEMEDTSVYQPVQKQGRIQTIAIPKSNERNSQKRHPSAMDEALEIEPKGTQESRRKERERPPETADVFGNSSPPEIYSISDFVDQDWVDLADNPWGTEGHAVGDVILFGPARGRGHFETFLPSNRYRIDPFERGSTYRKSHCLPEEGFSVVCLKRDMLGRVPWGFQVARDEFGHACLIASVELSSPASAATLIGASTGNNAANSALNVHDMIVMINGKPVGGMSEVGFGLELELSAPDLYLVVSRYKLAKDVHRAMKILEREALNVIDSASKDQRLVGWQEVGNGEVCDMTIADADADQNNGRAEIKDSGTPLPSTRPKLNEVTDSITNIGDTTAPDVEKLCDGQHETWKPPSDPELPSNTKMTPESPVSGHTQSVAFDDAQQPDDESSVISQETQPNGIANVNNVNDETPVESHEDACDDSNPWLGCICGEIHSSQSVRGAEMFWIQCDSCHSWYDVAEKCIGFSQKEAETKAWKCEGCESCESDEEVDDVADVDTNMAGKGAIFKESCEERTTMPREILQRETEQTLTQRDSRPVDLIHVAESMIEMGVKDPQRAKAPNLPHGQITIEKSQPLSRKIRKEKSASQQPEGTKKATNVPPPERASKRQASKRKGVEASAILERPTEKYLFRAGELVMMEAHSWPGVNHEGGVGMIVDIKIDEGGQKKLYDVKYMCSRFTAKGVSEEFLTPHRFD
ncbi:hypothetical protein IV203_010134 [Nitzschia inconspicua]|uniref:PDZ domain-containing protein n=1 Tax=Nitzschia inconspicua TaxID=303405 RepID=A0A9K3PMT8_9STRA|nr:hypothetical protein IV203_010134 [Nitzschia inconspicua]